MRGDGSSQVQLSGLFAQLHRVALALQAALTMPSRTPAAILCQGPISRGRRLSAARLVSTSEMPASSHPSLSCHCHRPHSPTRSAQQTNGPQVAPGMSVNHDNDDYICS